MADDKPFPESLRSLRSAAAEAVKPLVQTAQAAGRMTRRVGRGIYDETAGPIFERSIIPAGAGDSRHSPAPRSTPTLNKPGQRTGM